MNDDVINLAYHEAAHVVVGAVLGRSYERVSISKNKFGDWEGRAHRACDERRYDEAELMIIVAGVVEDVKRNRSTASLEDFKSQVIACRRYEDGLIQLDVLKQLLQAAKSEESQWVGDAENFVKRTVYGGVDLSSDAGKALLDNVLAATARLIDRYETSIEDVVQAILSSKYIHPTSGVSYDLDKQGIRGALGSEIMQDAATLGEASIDGILHDQIFP